MDLRTRRLCTALAELLSYPATPEATLAALREAVDLVPAGTPGREALARFAAHVETSDPSSLQELYTSTFDLQPACAPYFGHQLLGEEESARRGPLLARLAAIYAREGFRPREELADHVAEALRFVGCARSTPERDDLVRDGLVPALRRMLDTFTDRSNPYRDLLLVVDDTLSARLQTPATAEVAR